MSSNVRRLLAVLIAAAAIVSALAGCADAGTKKESGNESEAEKSLLHMKILPILRLRL